MKSVYNTIIIGGGASGLMCAKFLEHSALVVDFSDRLARKVLISGGGKCNYSNKDITFKNYVSGNPDFCRSALSRFDCYDMMELLNAADVEYEERKDGKLFALDSRDVVKILLHGCADFLLETTLEEVKREEDFFTVKTAKGLLKCSNLIVATGGLSIPALKVSDLGYKIAQQFGLDIETTSPALVQLDFEKNEQEIFRSLAGVSVFVEIKTRPKTIEGHLLFTHHGISGPAVLNASLYWNAGEEIEINFIPKLDWKQFMATNANRKLHTALGEILPQRFVRTLVDQDYGSICNWSAANLRTVEAKLKHFRLVPQNYIGFQKAEVTKGGVSTKNISSKTMEVKTCPGLYFIGEVLDVTGEVGGYNLHWAWASGVAAARAINEKSATNMSLSA